MKIYIWKFFFILTLIIASLHSLSAQSKVGFDKNAWQTSSKYRYEISKSSRFPNLENKSKKKIFKLLGKPNIVNGHDLIYCLDINDSKDCLGSSVTISTNKKIPYKYRVTFIWVEQ